MKVLENGSRGENMNARALFMGSVKTSNMRAPKVGRPQSDRPSARTEQSIPIGVSGSGAPMSLNRQGY